MPLQRVGRSRSGTDCALYRADNPVRALSFVAELRDHCTTIAKQPSAYALMVEYGSSVHLAVHGKYLIFHAVRDGALVIERILHGARHRPGLLQTE